ncbi:gastrokine-1 [Dermochelys coriacea]|uniref:gastrokine-1 n=1 Tax=Dermochelys coriacea TaxID=27794 RepID=UPI001CA89B7B|nr:gastrokine-1 [Dermochelys coriacea]
MANQGDRSGPCALEGRRDWPSQLVLEIVIASLLGVFLTPSLATDNVNENNQGNNGGNSQQTVSINKDKHVAITDTNNGWNSWNSIWDDSNGFMATRVFSKKSCIIAKMNKDVMPDIAVIPRLISERKKAGAQGPRPKELRFVVSKTRVPDLTPYGKNIEAMCRGLPTYVAHEAERVKGANFFYSGSCFQASILWIINIAFCGEVSFK